jgi:S-DNA-T family DNA segregation ATPase FtsK/SpoIIIE
MDDKQFKIVPFPADRKTFLRTLIVVIAYIILVLLSLTILEEKLRMPSLINIIWFILCVLLAVKLWKRFLSKEKDISNIKEQLQYFISANKLYETETYEVRDKDGKMRKQEQVCNYAVFGYWEDYEKLIIRAYKRADIFSDKMNSFETLLQALTEIAIEQKNDTITHTDYIFKKKRDKRLIVSSEETIKYNNSTIIPLNTNLSWDIKRQPHALVCGVSGGGKTTYIFYLLIELLKMKSTLYICDPKASDLGSLKYILGEEFVATEPNHISRVIRQAKEEMANRYKTYKDNPENFKFGASYVDYKLNALVIIFDEMGAFRAAADKKNYSETMANLTEIVLKGREMGVFVILSTQQANSNNIPTELRENLSMRVALGNIGNEGYRMIFGESNNNVQSISTTGGAYIYLDGLGWDSPKQFEAPFVDYKNFDFIEEIKKYKNA